MNRILFVDDEVRVLRGLQNALRPQRRAWEMTFVSSAAEAVEALGRQRFDVLVTDIRMPGMDGVALLRHVRATHPGVVCLALSGYAEYSALEAAESMAFRFLLKPCEPGVLRSAIEGALQIAPGASDPVVEEGGEV